MAKTEHGFDDAIHCSECRVVVAYALRGAGCLPTVVCPSCRSDIQEAEDSAKEPTR